MENLIDVTQGNNCARVSAEGRVLLECPECGKKGEGSYELVWHKKEDTQ